MKIVLCKDYDWLLSEEAFSIYASCMYNPNYNNYKEQIKDYLLDPSIKIFVYEEQSIKSGLIILNFLEDTAEIIGIAVSENYRRKGIGKQLIQHVMESENIEYIKAQTDNDSIGFYRKCGFSEEKTTIEYPDGLSIRYNCVLHKK